MFDVSVLNDIVCTFKHVWDYNIMVYMHYLYIKHLKAIHYPECLMQTQTMLLEENDQSKVFLKCSCRRHSHKMKLE